MNHEAEGKALSETQGWLVLCDERQVVFGLEQRKPDPPSTDEIEEFLSPIERIRRIMGREL